MEIRIKRITPVPDKGLVWVTLILRGESAEQYQKEKYPLLLSQYKEMQLTEGEIDAEQAERIADESGVCRAYVRGLTSLSYGDRSARELTYKLVQKGCDKEHAARAVAMLIEAGYLRESSAALREAERSVAKNRSRRRVEYDLRAKGYDASDADVQAYLDEVDFDEVCAKALAVYCRHGLPEGEELKKLYQKMLAQGFVPSEVKNAFAQADAQEE
ncbi:MAG: RecX family transcriptional regulator [Clostridia bacterium]|nr:RecX family transcriptional regulator [Clostridia bacterium]